MKAHLFTFDITDFEEVYAVLDDENKRLHISPLNYKYNITLNLNGDDLFEQLERRTKWEEGYFGERARKVARKIIEELQL